MTFDLSRVRFDARRDFHGVIMQQGRVQLDADWNEWVAELSRRLQAGTLDTFNGSVVPRTTPDGFRIDAQGGELLIGVGRIYVDGILAENHGGLPGTWDSRLAEEVGSAVTNYTAQPYYPDPPELPQGAGPHLVYLDVWQRDVTHIIAPDLVEQAVGVDTTGRLQTVWQVKVLPDVGNINCSTDDQDIPGWSTETAVSAARLTTATGELEGEEDPCQVPPAAGYRGLENQLYRVEVHVGGSLGDATFKWSRDNATVMSRVSHINPAGNRITVESVGRDDVLRFHDGDWVEVTDDHLELHNLPGELRRIRVAGGVDEVARTLEFDQALTADLFPTDNQQATEGGRNTRVRRWDQSGQVRLEDGSALPGHNLDAVGSSGEITIQPAGERLFLEYGILVDFDLDAAGGVFKTGDYWLFAARSVDASIELLDNAPPLGIHHHYARLGIVTLPEDELDCRTLWPPLAEGEGCDCTVCVTADNHNNGTATIQQAIDSVASTGGTICLGAGSYNISAALNVNGARSLRFRGQGWATLLVSSIPGSVISIARSNAVAFENLTVIGSSDSRGTSAMISAQSTLDLRCEHINILGLALPDATSVGIGLSGNMLGVTVSDCVVIAEVGIARAGDGEIDYLLSAELRVIRNILFCPLSAVRLDDASLHYGNTSVSGNLMLSGRQSAINTTGAVLPGSVMNLNDNVIYTTGNAIHAGLDSLNIERNEISGFDDLGGDGIVLGEGLDPKSPGCIRVSDNRISNLQRNAILITHEFEQAIISGNQIKNMGFGALIMGESAAVGDLCLRDNHCHHLGLLATSQQIGFAAVQLLRVANGSLSGNVIAEVAVEAIGSPGIDALRSIGVGKLHISGNRFAGIGPVRSSGAVTAIHILPPFDRVAIDNNQVERGSSISGDQGGADWRAIVTGSGFDRGDTRPGSFISRFSVDARMIASGDAVFVLTPTRLAALPAARSDLSIRGNLLRAQRTNVALNLCTSIENFLFSENHCETHLQSGSEFTLGQFSAHTITVTSNRLQSLGDQPTLFLNPQIERAIVSGNTSTGEIAINGASVPADMQLHNIIGV